MHFAELITPHPNEPEHMPVDLSSAPGITVLSSDLRCAAGSCVLWQLGESQALSAEGSGGTHKVSARGSTPFFLQEVGWFFFSFLNSSSRKGSFRLFVHYLHLTAFWFGQQLADAYLPQWQGQGCSEVFVVGQLPPLCSSHFRAFHPLLQAMPVLTFAITEIFRGGVRETNGKGWEGQYF